MRRSQSLKRERRKARSSLTLQALTISVVSTLLEHAAERRLEVAALGDVQQEGVVGAGAGQAQHLRGAARLPGGAADRVAEVGLAHQARAGTGQEDSAGGDRLEGQAVHVQVALQGEVQFLAGA